MTEGTNRPQAVRLVGRALETYLIYANSIKDVFLFNGPNLSVHTPMPLTMTNTPVD